MQADSEARIALLRKRAKKGKSKEEDQAEKALERQLTNKGRTQEMEVTATSEDGPTIRKREDANVSIMSADGHCKLYIGPQTKQILIYLPSQLLCRS